MAAQCGLRAGQRSRQEIGELVRVRGREWASVVVTCMVSEVVVEQEQEQQDSAEDAAHGAGGRQKLQAQVDAEVRQMWWREERRRVRWAKRAAGIIGHEECQGDGAGGSAAGGSGSSSAPQS